jgi:hypothetical protein
VNSPVPEPETLFAHASRPDRRRDGTAQEHSLPAARFSRGRRRFVKAS